MADVGVLNLQIHDNSEQAGKGLDKLADALSRVREAIGAGIKMSGVSHVIKNIANAVNENISSSTISKISEFSSELERLRGFEKINISIKITGAKWIKEMLQSIMDGKEAFDDIRFEAAETGGSLRDGTHMAAEKIEDGFETAHRTAESINELVQNMNYTAGGMAETFSKLFAMAHKMRMASSLGSGDRKMLLGEGFIQGEGTVTGPNERIGEGIGGFLEGAEEVRENLDTLADTEDEIAQNFERILESQREAAETARQINESVESGFGRQFFNMNQTDAMASELTKLDLLKAQLRDARIEYNKFVNQFGAESSKTVKAGLAVQELQDKIRDYLGSLNEFNQTAATKNVGEQTVENYAGMSQADLLTAKYDAMKQAIIEKVNAGRMDEQQQIDAVMRLQKLGSQIESLRGQEEDAAETTGRFRTMLDRLKESAKNSSLGKLAKQFERIIKYRAIRAVIKHISDGFREGVENVYRYSTAIGGSFASSMDSAASSLLQMKNSIGAAAAPLIESLIPYLQTAVNWFIEAVNYANQFFALMRGQATWTRAVPATAKAFDDQKKAAKGASAAVKDLLADWDELNIIQSETGGGSGDSSTTKAEDYLKMFEEESTFNNHVARFVQDIKNSFSDIYELVGLVAAGIAGWKISQAFENTLGTLGRLAAGISISIIGVKLAHGSGFTAGQNGGFAVTDIITSIGGAMASGLGGTLITKAMGFSTPVGFAIGLSVGIIASLVGYIEGSADKEDALKWGTNSMTPEQVQQYVEGQFNFPIMARIDLLNGIIENQEQARTALNGKIKAFSNSLSKVSIRADGTPEGIQAAADDIAGVIGQINQNLKDSQTNLEALLKITPVYSDGGDDVSGDVLANLQVANKKLSEYFTDIGKEIADWIDKGQKSQWKNNEAEMALQLMEHQKNILAQANNEQIKMDFGSDTALNLVGVMDRNTAEAAYAKQVEIISEYRDKILEATKNQIRQNNYYAALADAAGLKDDEGNPLSDYYKNANEVLIKQIEDGTIYDDLNPALEDMRNQWIETLKKVYGKEIGTEDFGVTNFFTELWGNLFGGGTTDFERAMSAALTGDNGIQNAANVVSNYLDAAIASIDPDKNIKKMAEFFGFSIFDLMEPPKQSELVQIIKKATGGNTEIAAAIMSALGWDSTKVGQLLAGTIVNADTTGDVVREATDNASDEQTVLPIEATPEFVMEDGDFNITEALEADPVGVPVELKPEVSMAGDVQSDIQEATEQIQESMSALRDLHNMKEYQALGNDAQAITNMVRNIALSGGSMDDLKAAISQIRQMYSVDAFNEAVPLLNKIMQEYKEILNDNTPAVGKMPNSRTIASAGMANSGYSAWGISGTGNVSVDENQMANSVQRGTATANEPMVDNMRLILTAVRALANRPINVNLTPSAGMARMNRRSADALENVTGTFG